MCVCVCVCVCVFAPPTHSPADGEAPKHRNHFSSSSLWILEPQTGFLGEKNQKAVPCPFLAVLPPLKPGTLRDTTPQGVSGTLAGRERVLNHNRQGLPKAGSTQPGGLWDGV